MTLWSNGKKLTNQNHVSSRKVSISKASFRQHAPERHELNLLSCCELVARSELELRDENLGQKLNFLAYIYRYDTCRADDNGSTQRRSSKLAAIWGRESDYPQYISLVEYGNHQITNFVRQEKDWNFVCEVSFLSYWNWNIQILREKFGPPVDIKFSTLGETSNEPCWLGLLHGLVDL